MQRGREAAARDLSNLIALTVEDEGALANRLPSVDFEPDPLLRNTILKLTQDAHVAGKAALGAAALVDGERQAGHHRRRTRIEIVAVKRQSRLQP